MADNAFRDLERRYRASPTEELRSTLNAYKLRGGLPLEPPECRLFHPRELMTEGELGVQSYFKDKLVTSLPRAHDGWWGIIHLYRHRDADSNLEIGEHLVSRGYGHTAYQPSRYQMVLGHLHVMYVLDTEQREDDLSIHGLKDEHLCEFNYDLSVVSAPFYEDGQVVEIFLLRDLL